MKSLAVVVLGIAGIFASSSLASVPVTLPEAGLIISLPSGWDTVSVSDTEGVYYLWFPQDTSLHVYAGTALYSGLSSDSDSVAGWGYEMSYAEKIRIEFDVCGGVVYSWTSYTQDSLPAAYVNSLQSTGDYCDTLLASHDRYFAYGTHGWEVYLEGDSGVVSQNYTAYAKNFDSITVIRSWAGASGVTAAGRAKTAFFARQSGEHLVLHGPAGAEGTICDFRGRTVGHFTLDGHGNCVRPLGGLAGGSYVMRAAWRASGVVRTVSASFFVAR